MTRSFLDGLVIILLILDYLVTLRGNERRMGNLSSEGVGKRLEDEGYLLSYRSAYLLKRNWFKICFMESRSSGCWMPFRQFCLTVWQRIKDRQDE